MGARIKAAPPPASWGPASSSDEPSHNAYIYTGDTGKCRYGAASTGPRSVNERRNVERRSICWLTRLNTSYTQTLARGQPGQTQLPSGAQNKSSAKTTHAREGRGRGAQLPLFATRPFAPNARQEKLEEEEEAAGGGSSSSSGSTHHNKKHTHTHTHARMHASHTRDTLDTKRYTRTKADKQTTPEQDTMPRTPGETTHMKTVTR